MTKIVVAEARRTPFGKFGGALRRCSSVDLGARVVKAVLERSGVAPEAVSETLFGSAILAGATPVVARQINFHAGIPDTTPSMTLDRACCSSMSCVGLGVLKIRAGDASVVIAGGADSSSQTPYLLKDIRWERRNGNLRMDDPMQFKNPITNRPLATVTGEMALKYQVSREEQDEWAVASHEKYFQAFDAGFYEDELVPMDGDSSNDEVLRIDESPRRTVSLEVIARLPTVYGSATVTAGNAPGLNDGASAILLASDIEAGRLGMYRLAEVVSYVQLSGDLESSVYMPGNAIRKGLRDANLALSDLKRIEINEAFAAMPLVSTKTMAESDVALTSKLRSITNVNGGAVAIGHPPGASGARVIMSLVRELRRGGGGYGAAAICGGFGQADAVIVKV
ncbi:thiolase family protein [Bradyrhizobium sp. B097]|uniref:thiolase family protein n=1 Tax=Bradyrhizobium sp. B097 TaxID=3140244 RepID=UPI0031843981